jgi:hypothetical protein
VVTLFTDEPLSRRQAYVGIDNRAAGSTAAYLLTQWSPQGGTVPVTVSSSSFRGEEELEMGLRAAMRQLAPSRAIREVTETQGLDAAMLEAVSAVLAEDPTIDAVYSAGRGNRDGAGVRPGEAKACPADRPRPGRRQHPAPAAATDRGGAPPRPGQRHAPGLPHHDAGPGALPGHVSTVPRRSRWSRPRTSRAPSTPGLGKGDPQRLTSSMAAKPHMAADRCTWPKLKGSGTNLVLASRCVRAGGEQDASAEEVEAGAAVHLALDGLDAVHVSLDGPGAVGQGSDPR